MTHARFSLSHSLSIAALCVSLSAICQNYPKPFVLALNQCGITLTKPAGMKETPVIPNDELNYQYAIKDSVNQLEIRYLVYPLQDLMKKYNTNQPDSGMPNIDPNFMHTNILLAYSLKIQGKDLSTVTTYPELHELPHATCQKEFGADWAAKVEVQPCDEFGQKYKYCTLLEIHKDNIADAFIIFLYNRNGSPEDLLSPVFNTLRF